VAVLAKKPRDGGKAATASDHSYLAVDAAAGTFGVPLGAVREVLRPLPVTPVPRAHPVLRGVVSVRGSITTVVNLAVVVGQEPGPASGANRIVLVDDGKGLVGLWVDRVRQVHRLPASAIEDRAELASDLPRFLAGIARVSDSPSPLVLLDIGAILDGLG
jgi:purine-binding chemotaxis protein CheW